MRPRSSLRGSQVSVAERIVNEKELMLSMGMGLGKTGTALTAFRDLLDTFQVRHILVIAPLLVAEETWPEEIETWEHTSVLDYEVLTGPPDRREQRAKRLPEISIINTENVTWLIELWGDDWPYDMVCVDEISRFKNPSKKTKPTKVAIQKIIDETLRSLPKGTLPEDAELAVAKAVKKAQRNPTRFGALCKVRKQIDRVIGLTGTMAPNGLLDIWSQFYLLDQGQRLGSTFNAFRTRWFESDYMGFKYAIRPGSFEQIVERIKDITVSMKTEDYADMPPVLHNVLKVRLPKKVMDQYRKFEKTLMLEEHDIEAVNNGVLTGKLLQLANGSVYDENGDAIEVHSLKMDALDRVIEEAAGAPVLVAYSYQFDLEKLRKKYPHAEVVGEAANLQKRWNNKEISILLAHPQSAGHGLNLQYGGHVTVWYGLCWSLEYYQQLNKRLHRPGQTETVIIHHIVAEGTVDDRVMAVLPEKDATQNALVEATLYQPDT
jgi:SNF2 family DNA or RNA helicase